MPNASTEAGKNSSPDRFPWRLFWFLLIASLAGAGASIPLMLEVFRPLMQSAGPAPLPLPLIIAIGAAQNLLLLGLAIGVGLLLARRLGLGAPLLEAWLYRKQAGTEGSSSVVLGAMTGIILGVVLLIPLLIAAPYLPGLPLVSAARAALWKRFLAGFYGGIVEEVLMRLFLLSLFAWLGLKILRKGRQQLTAGVFWIANIIVAILFGLGHLPSASLVMKITPAVVLLALVLNGIAAVSFGYLYWKRGLESAMIAHFSADFILYVVGPTFL